MESSKPSMEWPTIAVTIGSTVIAIGILLGLFWASHHVPGFVLIPGHSLERIVSHDRTAHHYQAQRHPRTL